MFEEVGASFHGVFATDSEQLPALEEEVIPDERDLNIKITTEEVRKQVASLDESEAIGLDKVSPWMLKEAAQALRIPPALIFNKSLPKGELPSCWMEANVVPICKKGDREEPPDNRLVSLRSIPCKVLERITRIRIVVYCGEILVCKQT
ncbi:uncharacterized protein [Procambarus clarkii]|uniref:uncharacterized protein n=1 Tax=Procambarus clarkii TaxID=6728 RepID=UPI00374286DC